MVRRTYDGWGYSPLDQITPANVGQLRPAWVFSTGVGSGHEAAPVVVNGVMFLSTPEHRVVAIDAKTGVLLWRYVKQVPEALIAPHPTSRGIALYGDKVFFAANDAVLVALDARTGRQVWSAKVAENKDGYYMTLAPLVADGKVMVGASGGELGVRGFVAAYDAETGKPLWRTYTVPAPGEPGSETWPKGDQWKNGGAPVWVTGQLRPRHEAVVLGHRQRRPVDGRPAARRQPLHRVHGRHRRGDRRRSKATSSTTRTTRGTGTRCRRRSSWTTSATAAR